jgi:alkylation response protein AidB-like acyl-CoA dehydrogenase
MLGPDPQEMGVIKNYLWGNVRDALVCPYPEVAEEEKRRCDGLLAELDEYLKNEHPHFAIDVGQQIPGWVIKRLFDMGVMGMIIPREYGGGGFGVTSYNRVLERIGRSCGSTAVLVSAHQSIGCGAIILFGTEEQKRKFLPHMARDMLSAFCLSEPNVGCDASGQETEYKLTEDGRYYILNGEKKWATSGALCGLFTVTAKRTIPDPETGESRDKITAFICTPDMEGIDIFSRNRSKCGIRGTWQARIRFTDVKVPKENLLHEEGKGIKVALSCLDYGRSTLSAGMLGAAAFAREQAVKWAKTRYQFDRPIAEFELIRHKIASMTAYCYAMDAVLYMTTGMLDRKDEDVMLETAVCKVFCSEMGFRTVDHAMQVMGGEGYMTENVVERLWRDNRINTIVEGANEVMYSFIFGYGTKQLGEYLLELKANPLRHLTEALKIGGELYLGLRLTFPRITGLHPRLNPLCRKLERHIQALNHQTKQMLKEHKESLITRQMIQARLSIAAVWIHAMMCSLSKMDRSIRRGMAGAALEEEMKVVEHVSALAAEEIDLALRGLRINTDETMRASARVAIKQIDELPNSDYVIPEKTPDESAYGTGKKPDQTHIPQFGSGHRKF